MVTKLKAVYTLVEQLYTGSQRALAVVALVGECSRNSKFSTHHQDQSMEFTSNEREGVHLHTIVDHDAEALQERG